MPYEYDREGNPVWKDKPSWPKSIHIPGDMNLIKAVIELMASSWKMENQMWAEKGSPESQFLSWLGEWYPELYEEFNKVLSGKVKFDTLPKYDLKED